MFISTSQAHLQKDIPRNSCIRKSLVIRGPYLITKPRNPQSRSLTAIKAHQKIR